MEPKVTYTFSRALHMMRYGGKKMKPTPSYDGYSYMVIENVLYRIFNDGSKAPIEVVDDSLSGYEIMGSWVEVKE